MTTVLEDSDVTIVSPVFGFGDTGADTTGNPTCTVAREDGTALDAPTITAGTAGDGLYEAALTAAVHTTRVDRLTLTWVGTVATKQQTLKQTVEVVGAHYCPLSGLRSLPGLDDAITYPKSRLEALRDEFASLAERYCGISFIPRYASELVTGLGTSNLLLERRNPLSLVSVALVSISGTESAYTTTGWYLDPIGLVTAAGGFPAGSRIRVRYIHGYPTPPADIVEACKIYVRAKALETNSRYGRDILSQSQEGISIRYENADWRRGRPTNLLDVNRTLNGYKVPTV